MKRNVCDRWRAVEDWDDFSVLFTLQMINGVVGYYEERSAGDAIAALKASLAPRCSTKRDGVFETMVAKDLVPGDLINIKLGDIVPADCKLKEGKPLEVDQSALTGESLPVTMHAGDMMKARVRGRTEEINARGTILHPTTNKRMRVYNRLMCGVAMFS